MNTKILKVKRCVFLLAGFLIFNTVFAQQNFLGFAGNNAELIIIDVWYFSDGQTTSRQPDSIKHTGSVDEFCKMGFYKVSPYIFGTLKFEKNKLKGSFISMVNNDHEINVNVIEKQTQNGWGRITISDGTNEPLEVSYQYEPQGKNFFMQYIMSERETLQYDEQRMKKINEGLALELNEEEENNSNKGVYTITASYRIKN